MRKLLSAILVVATLSSPVCWAQAQLGLTIASMVLSVTRIALNLGQGRQEYVQVDVVSEARTLEQAKNLGFRTAVEQAVGTVVASQSESQNQRLARDEIITYSSGFVDKFEILEQEPANNGVKIKMRVWVAESKLAHRLLGQSADGKNVDGTRLGAQLQTMVDERNRGDALVATVVRDYPKHSFDIEVRSTRPQFNEYRQIVLDVDVVLRWNRPWVNALIETLNKTNDRAKTWIFYNHAVAVDPVMRVSAVDATGKTVSKTCVKWTLTPSDTGYVKPTRYMIDMRNDQLIIDPKFYLNGTVKLNLTNAKNIEKIDQIRAEMVPATQC